MSDVAYNAGLEIRYAIAASGVDPIQHIPEVDAIIERRLAEARKAAFIEAAEMIEDNMLVDWDGPYREKMIPRSNPGNKLGMAYAAALRAKAEEAQA